MQPYTSDDLEDASEVYFTIVDTIDDKGLNLDSAVSLLIVCLGVLCRKYKDLSQEQIIEMVTLTLKEQMERKFAEDEKPS